MNPFPDNLPTWRTLAALGLLAALPLHADPTVTVKSTYDRRATAPVEVDFSYHADPDDLLQWSWDFGDGATSLQAHPSHTYMGHQEYTVRFEAVSMSRGPIVEEIQVAIANLLVEDDFDDPQTTINSQIWEWPTGSELEENFIDLGAGDFGLAFPVVRGTPAAVFGRRTQSNSSPLICLEPPGHGGGPPWEEVLRSGRFRFEVVLDSEGLPEGTGFSMLRLDPSGVHLEVRFENGGYEMQLSVAEQLTPWIQLEDGAHYRLELDLIDVGSAVQTVLRLEDLSPAIDRFESWQLNASFFEPWDALSLGAFDVSVNGQPFTSLADLGWVYLNNVRAYRYMDPEQP